MKKLLRIIVLIILATCSTSTVMNIVFYAPVNYGVDITPLTVLTQTIAPYTQYVYEHQDRTIPRFFSFCRYKISMQKVMNENGFNQNLEHCFDIDFFLGEVCQSVQTNSNPDAFIVLQQKDFQPTDEAKIMPTIEDDLYYEACIGFSQTLSLENTIDRFSDLLQFREAILETGERWQGGVMWFAVKTSLDPDDVCIGFSGPFSTYFFDSVADYPNIKRVSGVDFVSYRMLFEDSINYLIDHQAEVSHYLGSGIFGPLATIDFHDRLFYARNNGYPCIGFTVYLKGDALRELCADEDVILQSVIQKAIDGIE